MNFYILFGFPAFFIFLLIAKGKKGTENNQRYDCDSQQDDTNYPNGHLLPHFILSQPPWGHFANKMAPPVKRQLSESIGHCRPFSIHQEGGCFLDQDTLIPQVLGVNILIHQR